MARSDDIQNRLREVLSLFGPDGAIDSDGLSCFAVGEVHFERRDFAKAATYFVASLRNPSPAVDLVKLLTMIGRSLGGVRQHELALEALRLAFELNGEDLGVRYYLCSAYRQCGIADLAFAQAATLVVLKPDEHRYQLLMAQCAHLLTFGGYGHYVAGAKDYLRVATACYRKAAELRPASREAAEGLARLLLQTGDRAAAEEVVLQFIGRDVGDREKATLLRAYVNNCLDSGLYADVLAILPHLEKVETDRTLTQRVRRLCDEVAPDTIVPKRPTVGVLARSWPALALSLHRTSVLSRRDIERTPSRVSDWDWIYVPNNRFAAVPMTALQSAAKRAGAAGVRVLNGRSEIGFLVPSEVIRQEPARFLAADPHEALAPWRWYVHQLEPGPGMPPAPAAGAPCLVLLTRNGFRKMGGGERFVSDSARLYRAAGYRTITVGFDAQADGTLQRDGDTEYAFIREEVDGLRGFLLAHAVTHIQTMSGLGIFVMEATRWLDIRRIYGIHFWRELVQSPIGHDFYFPPEAFDRASMKLDRRFLAILRDFDYVYANSSYTHDIVVALTGAALPVVPSTAEDDFGAEGEAGPAGRRVPEDGYVLLANARPDKGLEIVLGCAERLPHIPFLVIASQTSPALPNYLAERWELPNVEIIERVEDMRAIYADAALVLAPSLGFIETFGRVPVEAARLGKPCLIGDAGNLPRLAATPEEVIGDDADAWAMAVGRFFADAAFRDRLLDAAAERNARWTQAAQVAGLQAITRRWAGTRILVCVGSGLGNVCHTTPLISALAASFGCAVDVLVAGDFKGTGAAVAGSPAVGMVFEELAHCESRAYDIVVMTHSFGPIDARFNTPRIVRSRDRQGFEPGGTEHEALFNVRVVFEILGREPPRDVVAGYFFGDVVRQSPGIGRIGLHAGSKGGKWAAKRWPHYEALTDRLTAAGLEVVCLGTADERVANAVDWTGGTIREMAQRVAQCDLMISNDSGVMNIANALGIPLVVFFAPTNPVTRGPINSPALILAPAVDCAPCEANPHHSWRFAEARCDCIGLVSADEALRRIAAFQASLAPAADGATNGADAPARPDMSAVA